MYAKFLALNKISVYILYPRHEDKMAITLEVGISEVCENNF